MTYRAQLLGAALLACASLSTFACGDDDAPAPGPETPEGQCEGNVADFRFETGSADGHADPFGAKAAGQARAGRVRDPGQIVHHPDARTKPRVDDFVMANDRIAVYVEKDGRKNGYTTLGGDIIVIDAVGDDGRPKGVGLYGDTAISFGRQAPKGTVTVLNDGSDGKAAIVRVSGVLASIPFFDPFRAVAQEEYDFPVAYDYVLEPGAEKVLLRVSLANTGLEEVAIGKKQFFGFFQGNLGQIFSAETGFAPPKGTFPWLAFDNGSFGFAIRSLTGPLKSDFEVQGFQLFVSSGATLGGCEKKTFDYVEIVGGGPSIDGLLQAKRRAFGEPEGRELRGVLKEENGGALAGAWVHAQSADGKYLTRVKTGADGVFVMHVPAGAVTLTPTLQGFPIPPATAVADGANDVEMKLSQRATIDVTAKDATSNEGLPVRVQIIPKTPVAKAPDSFGIREEKNGLWQYFSMDGRATLPVPAGDHHVIVSRGYEYEIHEQDVTATAGATTTVNAALAHSVDSTGVMCGDFHIHTAYSLDSNDDFEEKVKGAIADGLELPVSSEHQYIADFKPVITKLGVTKWANSILSAELTTFTWGHFGVIPAHLDPNLPNNGATDWMGRLPGDVFGEVNAAPEKPVIVVNHPRGSTFQGYFNIADFDRGQAKGNIAEMWAETFGALEVANGSSFQESRDGAMQDWFALLNAEKTYFGLGNSDSHDMRGSFVGYPRNCLRFGHDDPTLITPESARDALKAGANVISGGITMTVEAPGGIGPGGKATAGAYAVVVQSPSWVTPATVEVIVDGQTAQTVPVGTPVGSGPGKRFELTIDVQPTTSKARHWVLFHAAGTGDLAPVHPGRPPFAFSNPIFF
jgi:hypothetical protein